MGNRPPAEAFTRIVPALKLQDWAGSGAFSVQAAAITACVRAEGIGNGAHAGAATLCA